MKKISFHDQIAKNRRNSILLTFFVFVILLSFIYIISILLSPELSMIFLIIGGIIVVLHIFISFRYGDKIVLKATSAKPADKIKHAHLINVVEGLSIAAGIPKPKVYVIESDEMNAFATGRDPKNSSIAVTTGLLKNLKRDELEGVIGHELSHIRNYDIRFATLVAVLVGLVAILSNMFLRSWRFGMSSRDRKDKGGFALIILLGLILAIFAPFIARLVQFAVSRKREFLADASSAQLTRYPEGLASALEKIMKFNKGKMHVSEAISHLFFVDPNRSPLDRLYQTHPPIEERIRILRSM